MKKVSKLQIADSYAEALYEAAKKENSLTGVFQDTEALTKVTAQLSEFKLFNNPLLTNNQKKELAAQISNTLKLLPTTAHFLEIVSTNNRIADLQSILSRFKKLFYKAEGIVQVNVESVQKLSAEQDKKLHDELEKRLKQKIIINYIINPRLLGGLIVQYGSTRIDDSLAGKLNRLEQVMKG